MQLLGEALTFDDVMLLPARSAVLPRDVSLSSRFTRKILLNTPLISAAMDTVTESRTAICLAQEGGIGVLHKNMTTAEQALEVRRVKRYEAGVVKEPITVQPDTLLSQVRELSRQHGYSGFPVLDADGKLCGIITNRDVRFEDRPDILVKDLMTSGDALVTVKPGTDLDTCKDLFRKHRIEKLPVVDADGALAGMVTVRDIEKTTAHPQAARDEHGRLLVAGAIGASEQELERLDALVVEGIDAVVIDTAHGHSEGVMRQVKVVRAKYPDLQIVAGNIATAEAAKDLVDLGVDAIKVGIGPGSICTTRVVTGVGVPQITAISQCADAIAGSGVPVIADGGVRFSGDVAKAIAAGASTVMLGSMFAGTDESPGETILYQGRTYKSYRGMGSLGAMKQGSKDRYFQSDVEEALKLVPEGIEGRVPYRGSLGAIIHQMVGGLRASMGYTGNATIVDMQNNTKLVKATAAGLREAHVHDVNITEESPNYRLDS